jgi:hypothetical protein
MVSLNRTFPFNYKTEKIKIKKTKSLLFEEQIKKSNFDLKIFQKSFEDTFKKFITKMEILVSNRMKLKRKKNWNYEKKNTKRTSPKVSLLNFLIKNLKLTINFLIILSATFVRKFLKITKVLICILQKYILTLMK